MSSQLDSLRDFVGNAGGRTHRQADNVIVLAGGKGGAGTSTIAALIAAAAARNGHSTLLVDASSSASTLLDLLAIAPADDDGISTRAIGSGLHIAARPVPDTASSLDRRSRMRRLSTIYPNHRLVIVDAGASADAISTAVSGGAARLIAVATTDRLGIAATYAAIKYAAQQFPLLPASVLVNRSDLAEATAAYGRIAGGIEEFLGRTTAFAGALPDDDTLLTTTESGLSPIESLGKAAHAAELLADLFIASGSDRYGRPHLIRTMQART
jgi:flagellar biosynthesis protein FlhG